MLLSLRRMGLDRTWATPPPSRRAVSCRENLKAGGDRVRDALVLQLPKE